MFLNFGHNWTFGLPDKVMSGNNEGQKNPHQKREPHPKSGCLIHKAIYRGPITPFTISRGPILYVDVTVALDGFTCLSPLFLFASETWTKKILGMEVFSKHMGVSKNRGTPKS